MEDAFSKKKLILQFKAGILAHTDTPKSASPGTDNNTAMAAKN